MNHIFKFKDFSRINESIRFERIDPSFYEKETVTSLPYSNLIGENRNPFLKKIIKISENLGIEPIWLLHTIYHESGFDPKKMDKFTGAIGLLSFFPEIIKEFIDVKTGKNITPNDVLNMDNVEQLDLINSFYQTWIDELKLESPLSPGDFAALTFYPSVIKKDWDWEFPEYVVEQNAEMFKNFPTPGVKTKKNYYDYIDQIFRKEEAYKDSDGEILSQFSGAFVLPSLQREKKPLEYFSDLIQSKSDPTLTPGVQDQDTEATEKFKQKG